MGLGIRSWLLNKLLPPPVHADGAHYSMIFSAHDDVSMPTKRLIDVALQAAQLAGDVSLADISARMKEPPYYPDVWPGEHYKLLSALVAVIAPTVVIEIGTYTGISALAIKRALPVNSRLFTFDIVPWNTIPGTVLVDSDFEDGKLTQLTDDVTSSAGYESRKQLFEQAQLIFVDAAKDSLMEQRLLDLFAKTEFAHRPIIMFDDIRLWPMLKIWREIVKPKLDITSLGHWSGTGLIDWCGLEQEVV